MDVSMQHAHVQGKTEQTYIYITMKMSMQHRNIQRPTRRFSFFWMFPCSMLIFTLKMSTLHGNIQKKTKKMLLRFWMFQCCVLMKVMLYN